MTERGARRRAGMLLAGVLLSMIGLGVRLGHVQVVRSEAYADLADRQRLRKIDLPPARGTVYDRDGEELAIAVPARTVYANPRQILDPAGTARALAPVLGRPEPELDALLREDRGFVYLARRIDVAAADRISSLRLGGIGILDEARRAYPNGTLAASVLGFIGTDATGLAGVEFAYDDLLSGEPGYRVLEQDPLGRRIPQGRFHEEPPIPGSHLVLTIDREIQNAAERALRRAVEAHGAEGGAVTVLDPRTGEILAMANLPTFDPNAVPEIDPASTRNRIVTDVFEPGSVNKIVVAAAVLEEGIVSPSTAMGVPATIRVADAEFGEPERDVPVTMLLEDVIAHSSNVGTIKLALQLGPDRLNAYLERFRYGEATTLGFPGETSGVAPSAGRWRTSLPTMAIGQGVSATQLQLARAFAAVANDGVMVEPKLVAGWLDPDGGLHTTPASRTERVVSSRTASQLRPMFAKTVSDGTGSRGSIPGYAAGGKTGTAQKIAPGGGYSGHIASFVGFVPVEDPQLVIAVSIDEPFPIWGGVVAAPVFAEVGQAAVRILRIPPQAVVPEGAGVQAAGGIDAG